MHNVIINKSGKQLNITLSGNFNQTTATHAINDIARASQRLQSRFNVIVDIRHIKQVNPELGSKISLATKMLEERGAKHIIRVVGSSKYALSLFAKNSKADGKAKIHFVPTLENAEELIKEL